MKKYLPMIFSGITCIPATYHTTRTGGVLFSLIIITVLAAIATMIVVNINKPLLWQIILCFVLGVLLAQTVSYTYWYLDYGHMDPKGNVGLYVSIIEAGVISVVGVMTATVVYYIKKYK